METIGFEELKEYDGNNINVRRKARNKEYNLKGKMEYHIIEGRDLFIVESETDSCFLKTGDVVRFGWRKYQVNLPK